MDDTSGAKPAHVSVQAHELFEHQRKLARGNARRFVALLVLILLGVGALVWLQVQARSTEELRTELVRQCEQHNAETLALRNGLGDAGVQSEDVDVQDSLLQAANNLKDVNCSRLD